VLNPHVSTDELSEKYKARLQGRRLNSYWTKLARQELHNFEDLFHLQRENITEIDTFDPKIVEGEENWYVLYNTNLIGQIVKFDDKYTSYFHPTYKALEAIDWKQND
jgi:hypothetical protein